MTVIAGYDSGIWRTAGRHHGRVAESLASQLLHADLELKCPACQYPIWVTWAEAEVQASILCPCCRARVRLTDPEGSMQNAACIVEREISRVLKGLHL